MSPPNQDAGNKAVHHPSELYTKIPLYPNTQTIRLLKLARNQDGNIIGCLRVHGLDDTAISWIALSYTWRSDLDFSGMLTDIHGVTWSGDFRGLPEGFKVIFIDGVALSVGSNLWRALDAILTGRDEQDAISSSSDNNNVSADSSATADREAQPRHPRPYFDCEYFWIDAVCIDQSRADEKTHQVPLMKDIFSGAKLVIGWLTPAEEVVYPSVSVIPVTIRCYERCDPHRDFILKNPYWRHMWIVQEIILAKTLVFLYKDMWITPGWIQSNSWNESLALIQDRVAFQDKRFMDFACSTRYLRLSSLIGRYQHQKCADDREKIYALLGLLPGTYLIRADYSKSVFQLAVDVVQIEAGTSLEFAYPWWIESLVRALNFEHDKSMRGVLVELFSHVKLFDETQSSLRDAEQVARMMIDTVDGRAYLRDLESDDDPTLLAGQLNVDKLLRRLESRMSDRFMVEAED